MALLSVKNINKHYKDFTLSDISFDLPAGYIMGFIGQNGAGKTTTLNAITHLVPADSGDAWIDGISFGKDPVAFRDSIGYIGDSSFFPLAFSAKEVRMVLKDFYKSFDPASFDSYLEKWNLPAKQKIKDYSRGMKVKLMFACALSRRTKVLILDEATNGLDPVMRRDVLALLQDYISDGTKSVLFSTHIMEDLEDIADYIFFIDNGREVLFETKEEIEARYLFVKGGLGDLTPELRKTLSGIEENAFGFAALFDTECGLALPPGLTAEKGSIDNIIVHMIRDGR